MDGQWLLAPTGGELMPIGWFGPYGLPGDLLCVDSCDYYWYSHNKASPIPSAPCRDIRPPRPTPLAAAANIIGLT